MLPSKLLETDVSYRNVKPSRCLKMVYTQHTVTVAFKLKCHTGFINHKLSARKREADVNKPVPLHLSADQTFPADYKASKIVYFYL